MNEKIRNLLESLAHDLAYDIIKKAFLVVFTSGFSFTGAYALLNKIGLPVWCLIILCIAIAALFGFLSLLLLQAISNHYTRSEKVDCNYEILEKTVTFKYDGTKCFYSSEIKIQFNKKTREYYGKFYWSGSGNGKIKPVNRNYTLNELKRRTRYIEYVVIFDRAYKKGQKLTFKLAGEMDDPAKQFSPYFATTVNDPTRKLKINLQIDPQKYPIEDLEQDIIPPTCCDHQNCVSVQLENDGSYSWEIPNPTLGYQYSLNWTFK